MVELIIACLSSRTNLVVAGSHLIETLDVKATIVSVYIKKVLTSFKAYFLSKNRIVCICKVYIVSSLPHFYISVSLLTIIVATLLEQSSCLLFFVRENNCYSFKCADLAELFPHTRLFQ